MHCRTSASHLSASATHAAALTWPSDPGRDSSSRRAFMRVQARGTPQTPAARTAAATHPSPSTRSARSSHTVCSTISVSRFYMARAAPGGERRQIEARERREVVRRSSAAAPVASAPAPTLRTLGAVRPTRRTLVRPAKARYKCAISTVKRKVTAGLIGGSAERGSPLRTHLGDLEPL